MREFAKVMDDEYIITDIMQNVPRQRCFEHNYRSTSGCSTCSSITEAANRNETEDCSSHNSDAGLVVSLSC